MANIRPLSESELVLVCGATRDPEIEKSNAGHLDDYCGEGAWDYEPVSSEGGVDTYGAFCMDPFGMSTNYAGWEYSVAS